MKPLIIGQAPSRSSDPSEPLSGRSGCRLADLCGLDVATFLATFERANLLDHYPGAKLKGDEFVTTAEARTLAAGVRPRLRGRTVVVLGLVNAAGFGLTQPAFQFAPHWEGLFAFSPHPSSVSRWWNDPANEARARAFWSALAREPPRP